MKKAVLQFTACCMAVGVSVASFGGVAFADQSGALAGFGLSAEADQVEEDASAEADEDSETTAQQTVGGVVMAEEEEEDADSNETVMEVQVESDDAGETGYGVIKYNAAGDIKEVSDEDDEDEEESESESETDQDETEAAQNEETKEEETEESLDGTQAFAQCEDYINVHKEAETDSEVVGKLFNDNAVTILEEDDDWFKIESGNVTGYAKAEYFATGEEAEKIAETAAQEMATVQTDILTVRVSASEDAESVGLLYEDDQVEVVSDEGDWIKVKLDDGSYGYVSAQYVECATSFTTGETIEEEQARLEEEESGTSSQESTAVVSTVYTGTSSYYYEEPAVETVSYEETYYEPDYYYEETYYEPDYYYEETYYEPDYYYEETYYEPNYYSYEETWYEPDYSYTETYTETYTDTSSVDALYQIYLDAQAAADAAATQGDEALVYETYYAAVEAYQAYINAVNAADAAAYAGTSTVDEETYTYTETYVDTVSVDEAYQNYVEKQAEADAATQQADEALVYETYNEAVEAYQEYLDAANGETVTVTETVQETVSQDGTAEETTVQTSTSGSYSSGADIASFATQFVGNPYVYGGTSLTNGADCSGFTQSVFANFGISIPRTAAAQSESGTAVSLDEIQPGDLLFYSDGSGIGHVTMYIGNDQVVHASTSSTGIIISDIDYRTPVSARRYW